MSKFVIRDRTAGASFTRRRLMAIIDAKHSELLTNLYELNPDSW